jgi:outer membrane protein OmpA-like peptidoglycan-associated protein
VLTAASEKTLDRLAGLLKSYPDARFLITGYTDARGSSAYNTDLSNRRAKRVYEALLERGVPAAMQTGKHHPGCGRQQCTRGRQKSAAGKNYQYEVLGSSVNRLSTSIYKFMY